MYPKFYVSLGIFGQYGWKKISLLKWIWYQIATDYVTKASIRGFKMQGVITKKNFFQIAKAFGWKKAFKILFSRKPTALLILI